MTMTGYYKMGNETVNSNPVEKQSDSKRSPIEDNIKTYIELASWISFYPDLFLDLVKPQSGGINLSSDQRIFLRCSTRFFSVYGCFPRGFGKTHGEVLAMIIISITHPNITLALTAQTKENAAELLKDKVNEILRQYPMLRNEIIEKKLKFQRGDAEVLFKNGAKID